MAEVRLFRLRVTFAKAGRAAYLSHLELTRALERSVRRANLPFAVTQGFSPHMRIAFGAALPVGIGGTNEIYDVYLSDYVSPARALEALQAASAKDLAPFECRYVELSDKAASVAFPISTYVAHFSEPIKDIKVPKTVTVKRKKKEKVLEVRDFLVGEPCIDGLDVEFKLRAKESGSLRADVFIKACLDETFGERTPAAASDCAECDAPQNAESLRVLSVTRIAQERRV